MSKHKSREDEMFDELVRKENVPESAKRLKQEFMNYIEFIEQIVEEDTETFSSENKSDLVLIYQMFKLMDPVALMQIFVDKVLPHSEEIKARKKSYFVKNVGSLFSAFPKNKVEFVLKILKDEKLSKDDLDMNWNYWEVFVDLAEKNKKTK